MTTENIDIRVREDGSVVVKRRLQDIAPAAREAGNAVDILKRALGGLSAVLAARFILQQVDAYTNLQNRLRSTGLEGQALTGVYRELLAVSNSSLASLQGSVELYARLSLSAKELGASQQELINFTKSLNQAIVLSGASGAEAEGGLIQLSQGLASGVLQGEELRSVLENLPAVADIIAKSLKITRGELRQFGAEGKITAQAVLKAFRDARDELEDRFGKTIPTLSQSFQVFRNNLTDFIGRLDEVTGFSRALSSVIFLLANNIDNIADAVGRLTVVLAAAAVGYALFLAAGKAGALLATVQAFVAYRQAIAAGTVVVLGSAEAERQRAVAALAGATAAQTATAAQSAAAVATARSAAATTAATLQQATATQAAIALTRSEITAKLAKANTDIAAAVAAQNAARAAGAQSFALATLRAATAEQTRAEAVRTTVVTQLAALGTQQARVTAAVTVATQANTAAQIALNQAQAAGAGAVAAATAATTAASTRAAAATAAAVGTTTLLGQALAGLQRAAGAAGGALRSLFLLVNTNPFAVLIGSLLIAVGLLAGFGDKFDAGIDGATTLRDVLSALGEVAVSSLRAVRDVVTDVFGGLVDIVGAGLSAVASILPSGVGAWLSTFTTFYDDVGSGFSGLVRGIAKTFDAIGGLVTGLLIFTARALSGLPEVFGQVFRRVYNVVIGVIEDLINTVISGVNKLRDFVGKAPLDLVKLTKLEVDEKVFKDYGAGLATSIGDGFEAQGGFLLGKVDKLFGRAQEIQQERTRKLMLDKPIFTSDAAGVPAPVVPKVDTKAIERAENALRSLINTIKPSEGAVLELAKAQKVLNEAQARGLITGEQNLRYYALAQRYYEDAINPLKAINRQLDEQAALLRVNVHEREVESQLYDTIQSLQKQGIDLTKAETDALRAKLQAMRDQNALVQAQDTLLANSVGKRREFQTNAQAISDLTANRSSGFTQGDKAQAVNAIAPDLFEGTQVQLDAQVATFQSMYDQIRVLREADLISEETAAFARARIDGQIQAQRLKGTQEFFGNLASLSSSGNKRIAAIGKAAALTQATIDGVVAVQKALAAPPGWPYNAANVISVGVSAAANVARIAGFQEGGYTGNMGTGKIAGVVHGQEYVVNAAATKRNRQTLEAMNAGREMAPPAGGGDITIIINNEQGGEVQQQERQTPNGREIELTIKRVVTGDIRRGGEVSQAMESQFGLNRAVGTAR